MSKQISRNEIIAMVGGAILAVSLFLPWYGTTDNPNAQIDGMRGDVSAWDVHTILRWLWLAAAASPFILTYIVLRGHALSWPRGEMTAVISLVVLVLIGYNGIVDRPGEPSGQIGIRYGWVVAVIGTLLMCAGSALRASES